MVEWDPGAVWSENAQPTAGIGASPQLLGTVGTAASIILANLVRVHSSRQQESDSEMELIVIRNE